MQSREQQLIKVSWISILGNAFLSALKIVIGFISGSLAVIADGVDSASDVLTSVITLITARIISRPPNVRYPYGYAKAESIATKALSFIILFAGAQLAINTTHNLIEGVEREIPSPMAFYVIIISIIGKLFLARLNVSAGKKTNSSMLIANGQNMQNDIIISFSVLVGLIFIYVLEMPVLDSVSALLVSLWIIKVGFSIFMKSNIELMDGHDSVEIYNKIFRIIDSVEGVHNPHRVRVRKIGYKLMIAADIEIDGNQSLLDAHEKAHKVEDAIKNNIPDVFEVFTHLEPRGDQKTEKNVGISRDSIQHS
ncbi:MAG: cation diffusion facilitator family transporter [Bacteroidetes bacterium]|jgi:cation diffusion facilitator family transporter|nr:cation diffusion facilitator family transporter [Bacteroidota bacterium]